MYENKIKKIQLSNGIVISEYSSFWERDNYEH